MLLRPFDLERKLLCVRTDVPGGSISLCTKTAEPGSSTLSILGIRGPKYLVMGDHKPVKVGHGTLSKNSTIYCKVFT